MGTEPARDNVSCVEDNCVASGKTTKLQRLGQGGEEGSQGSDDYVDPFSEVEDWELRWALGQGHDEGQEGEGDMDERCSPMGVEPRGDAADQEGTRGQEKG